MLFWRLGSPGGGTSLVQFAGFDFAAFDTGGLALSFCTDSLGG